MKNNISPNNNKQDVEIGKLQVEFTNLRSRFDKFISNDFTHLKDKVDKILITIVIGFLISIFLMLTSIILKIGL